MICRFNSNPMTPNTLTIRHSKCPALPKSAENAMETLKAHLIALVKLLPKKVILPPVPVSRSVRQRLNDLLEKSKLGVVLLDCSPTLVQKSLTRGQTQMQKAVIKNVKPMPLHISCLVQPKSSPKPKVNQTVPAMTRTARPIATSIEPVLSVCGGTVMRNPQIRVKPICRKSMTIPKISAFRLIG